MYILVLALIIYLYVLFLFFKRIYVDKKQDELLGIYTRGFRNWDKGGMYNRTESTPYLALEDFVKHYKSTNDGELVDFGAGKGRVAIYLNKKLNIPITAIEINELTFEEAKRNIELYKKDNETKLSLVNEYAEDYKITKEQRRFFLFNPFNVVIFRKVINNIKRKANEYEEDIEVILYYPLYEYQELLYKEGFEVIQTINPRNLIFKKEKFIVYRYVGHTANNK